MDQSVVLPTSRSHYGVAGVGDCPVCFDLPADITMVEAGLIRTAPNCLVTLRGASVACGCPMALSSPLA